ncbi:winged helix-turn-helix transcriptional regulator [Lysinibacillus sphaericus]|uniref:HTH-type transcriptional regulator ytcD n=1 Tax=Lysinibacillus sphaericus OT4b.31 TaxID=1285586 RepID=R7ZG43_LYSSH|nr:winged helix-turn-helix transcriptional regulator [Lysinibacillus sphaericus]EON73082.1 HTH-type transcriptional regulator ytcD [Lysinibacillus sphaericus OT4b.31]
MKKYNFSIEATLDIIGGKWKIVILCILMMDQRKRTSELKRMIPKITQKMLIQQLRELEKDHIIHRKVYNQSPPKVEYSLTEYGESLTHVIDLMCDWGAVNIKKRIEEGEEIHLSLEEND